MEIQCSHIDIGGSGLLFIGAALAMTICGYEVVRAFVRHLFTESVTIVKDEDMGPK